VKSCSILTTTPNAITSATHNGMPVILDPASYDLWLDPGMQDVAAISELLKPYEARLMRCYPVSARINHVENDDSDCSRPVEITEAQKPLFSYFKASTCDSLPGSRQSCRNLGRVRVSTQEGLPLPACCEASELGIALSLRTSPHCLNHARALHHGPVKTGFKRLAHQGPPPHSPGFRRVRLEDQARPASS
jgi:SOS response associated peptidase (SRAP)